MIRRLNTSLNLDKDNHRWRGKEIREEGLTDKGAEAEEPDVMEGVFTMEFTYGNNDGVVPMVEGKEDEEEEEDEEELPFCLNANDNTNE